MPIMKPADKAELERRKPAPKAKPTPKTKPASKPKGSGK